LGTFQSLRPSPVRPWLHKRGIQWGRDRDFLFGIACTTCGNGGSTITSNITFEIANATIADVTAPNNHGNIFVADVLAPPNRQYWPVDC
jgi:hypothetical protein